MPPSSTKSSASAVLEIRSGVADRRPRSVASPNCSSRSPIRLASGAHTLERKERNVTELCSDLGYAEPAGRQPPSCSVAPRPADRAEARGQAQFLCVDRGRAAIGPGRQLSSARWRPAPSPTVLVPTGRPLAKRPTGSPEAQSPGNLPEKPGRATSRSRPAWSSTSRSMISGPVYPFLLQRLDKFGMSTSALPEGHFLAPLAARRWDAWRP